MNVDCTNNFYAFYTLLMKNTCSTRVEHIDKALIKHLIHMLCSSLCCYSAKKPFICLSVSENGKKKYKFVQCIYFMIMTSCKKELSRRAWRQRHLHLMQNSTEWEKERERGRKKPCNCGWSNPVCIPQGGAVVLPPSNTLNQVSLSLSLSEWSNSWLCASLWEVRVVLKAFLKTKKS